jgi:hypothetical protein
VGENVHDDALLDADAILADATRQAGFDAWDRTDVEEPLALIIEALESEAQLSAAGRAGAGARLRRLLTSYVGMQRDAASHPEILDEQIAAPIVIVGLPRSGTTLLHSLLSSDPAHRAPRWWEALHPSPPPEMATYATDPRRELVRAEFDRMFEASPGLLAALPYAPDLAAECNTLAQPTLRSSAFFIYYHLPSFQDWYLDRADHAIRYRYHRRALKQLQWHGPKGRWVLKAPPHLLTMDALMAEYPDATIVHIHRDPTISVASAADLTWRNRILHSDAADPTTSGRDTLFLWALATHRVRDFRRRRADLHLIDVEYDDLVAKPIPTVASVYEQIGEELSAEAEASMLRWLVDNDRQKRPAHHYDLADFGLSRAGVLAELGDLPRT